MFTVGEQVIWKYQTGWGNGETARANAEIIKINRVKIKIRLWQKQGNEWHEVIKSVLPSSLESYPLAEETEDGREKRCRECSNWFLGCLNGREKWKDKAIMPNHRKVKCAEGEIDAVCDAFNLHPDPNRKGRVVY